MTDCKANYNKVSIRKRGVIQDRGYGCKWLFQQNTYPEKLGLVLR